MTDAQKTEERMKLAAYKEQLNIIKANKSNVTERHLDELNEVTSEYVDDKIAILEKEIAELEESLASGEPIKDHK